MASISVRDVAALAGVSVGTVSNVLNRPERVSEATAQRVQDAIDKLGFVRNDAARQLRAGQSRSIGLIVLDASNPFFMDLARGAEDAATAHHLSVLLGNSDDSVERERAYLELFEEQRVQGVLITPASTSFSRLQRLRDRGITPVLVDREARTTEFSSVSVNDVAGGRIAAEHLLSIGRRRLAFIGGPETLRQVADRIVGVSAAVAAVPNATLEVLPTASLSTLAGREVGFEIAKRRASERPDAIFCANDMLAVGVMQSLIFGNRIAIPDEIALIGYDDIAFTRATVVPMSSVRQPSALIGSTAVDLLLEHGEPRQVVFQPELVVRESTAG